MKPLQIFGLFLGTLVFANFVLLLFGIINPVYFWIATIMFAVIAYVILPKIKK